MAKGDLGAALRELDVLLRAGTAAGLSDGQLLGRFLKGRDGGAEAAFEALVRRHGPMVLATGRGVVRDEQQAEDVFQATFLVLARRAARVRDPERLGPWLHRVAVRIALRARSASARRPDRAGPVSEAEAMTTWPGPGPDADREELRGLVHEEVDRLPARYRAAVVLCYLEGETYEAAAARLRLPVGTIRSRLSRAKERLRGRLARRGLALPAALLASSLAPKGASAAVPAHLIGTTLKAVVLAGTSGKLTAGVASARAVAYAEAALRGSVAPWLKAGTAALVATGALGTGAVAIVRQERGPAPRAIAQPEPSRAQDPRPPTGAGRLEGAWVVVDQQWNGGKVADARDDRLHIQGERFVLIAPRGGFFPPEKTAGLVRIDPAADPPTIDLVLETPGRRPTNPATIPTYRGIYRLEAGRLTLCLDHPESRQRPEAFAANATGTRIVLTLKRDAAADKGRRNDGQAP